jgi:hypothetical protein
MLRFAAGKMLLRFAAGEMRTRSRHADPFPWDELPHELQVSVLQGARCLEAACVSKGMLHSLLQTGCVTLTLAQTAAISKKRKQFWRATLAAAAAAPRYFTLVAAADLSWLRQDDMRYPVSVFKVRAAKNHIQPLHLTHDC